MVLDQWAQQWGIAPAALQDLKNRLGVLPPDADPSQYKSEAFVQSATRIEASRMGARLWRNNVGAGKIDGESFVRWGLANESEKMNQVIKSSDLIGWTPVIVTPSMVGHRVAIFTAIETKAQGWQYRGTDREVAQLAWINAVVGAGGIGAFVADADKVKEVLNVCNK